MGMVVAITVIAGLISVVNAVENLEPILQQCCSSGVEWANNHTTCTGPPQSTIQVPDRLACLTTLYICCVRAQRKLSCRRGMEIARAGGECTLSPRQSGETFQDCCYSCSLGIYVGSRRIPCTFQNFRFGAPWDDVFSECCEGASSVQGTSALLSEKGRCDTNNPCSQRCEDIGDQVLCSCDPGYRLGADLTSCEDVNECVSKDACGTPGDECVNTPGSYICVPGNKPCPPGFGLQLSTGRCVDVDECAEGIDQCNDAVEICQNMHGNYQCVPRSSKRQDCPAGFKWNRETEECDDIDECLEGSHACNPATQNCVNAVGSYRCITKASCPHGYRWNQFRNKCDDVNECVEGTDDCDRRTEHCVNTPGSFQCQTRVQVPVQRCGTGFTYDSSRQECIDLDECSIHQPCETDQNCENTAGSYRCTCLQGYTRDAFTGRCKDVNECQLGLHSCGVSQRCDNTIGSFTCVRITSCGTGYTLNAASGHCEDDDECELGTHNCGPGFECRNTLGSFRCDRIKCPLGQKLLADGTCKVVICGKGMEHDDAGNCVDINECARSDACRPNQRCLNTVGSYRCQNIHSCGPGFELNELGNQCVDVDECARRIDECGPQQTCRNRPGGYLCECPRGYTLSARRECEDIDECTRYRGQVCSSVSECVNTQGSYVCNCKQGFRKADDGKNCIDVDECAESANICQHTCNNVWGSYQCTCNQGYTLNPDNRSCHDIDECKMWEGRGNLCIGFCVNKPGSYSCTCPSGYKLSSDMRTCQDIDECEQPNVCEPEEVCLNTRGGYKCNRIICPPNYFRDKDHRNRCKQSHRECQERDTECFKKPLSISYNYITFVSNIRIPASGQLDLFTMRGPALKETTVQFNLDLKEVRAPQGVPPATRAYFHLRRTAYNEAMLSLLKTISGPQEIELDLTAKIYHNGLYGGNAIAKIFIFVTEHEF